MSHCIGMKTRNDDDNILKILNVTDEWNHFFYGRCNNYDKLLSFIVKVLIFC